MVDKPHEEALALLKIVDAETDADERAKLMEIARKTIRRVSLQYGLSESAIPGAATAGLLAPREADDRPDCHVEVNVTPVSHFCLRHG